jgi:hypothetical protein
LSFPSSLHSFNIFCLFLPSFLPISFLPLFLRILLLSFLPIISLPPSLPSFLFLLSFLPSYLLIFLFSYLLIFLSSFLPFLPFLRSIFFPSFLLSFL